MSVLLVIRNRDELKLHLSELVSMCDGEIDAVRRKTAWTEARRRKELANPTGRRVGLMQALNALQAWENHETAEALSPLPGEPTT